MVMLIFRVPFSSGVMVRFPLLLYTVILLSIETDTAVVDEYENEQSSKVLYIITI